MQKYDAIESGIERGDVKALREAIGSICYTSRNFSSGEFDEVISYVESKGIVLKDDLLLGNPTISSQKNTFTDEDFTKAIFELKRNFCNDRIEDVKNIGRALYANQTPVKPASKIQTGSASPNLQSHQNNMKMLIGVGLVALIVMVVLIVLVTK